MPVKRPVDDDDGDAGAHASLPAKHSRLDLHVDYDTQQSQSASARKKGSSNRTGQACDRCKVRANLPVLLSGASGTVSIHPLTELLLTLLLLARRSERFAATHSPAAARHAHRTTPSVVQQIALQASPGPAAMRRTWKARTRVCARTLRTSSSS
jgi:hypothetical protein